jgi:phosphoglycolate phosphatase
MIRLAVFDLDGTLVDSRRDLATAANALVAELGGAPLSEARVGRMVGEGAGVLVRRALEASGLDPGTPGALERFLDLYDEHLLDTTSLYEGTREVLDTLLPRVPLAVLTNKPQSPSDRIIDALDLRRYFRAVIGGDGAHGRKPDPAGLLFLSRTFDTAPADTLMVGDSPIDLETGRRAGTRVCLLRYGFGFRSVELRPGECAIGSPGELTILWSD